LLDEEGLVHDLKSEIKLNETEAKIFLLIVQEGRANPEQIGSKLGITEKDALSNLQKLVEFGGLIEISENLFETMHPRFSAVNMYRRMCERDKIDFKRNIIVDNIGMALEKPYDDARTN